MEFTTIEMKVPVGYEDQIRAFVMTKIEGILSQSILSPTQEMKDEFATKMADACILNEVEGEFKERFTITTSTNLK